MAEEKKSDPSPSAPPPPYNDATDSDPPKGKAPLAPQPSTSKLEPSPTWLADGSKNPNAPPEDAFELPDNTVWIAPGDALEGWDAAYGTSRPPTSAYKRVKMPILNAGPRFSPTWNSPELNTSNLKVSFTGVFYFTENDKREIIFTHGHSAVEMFVDDVSVSKTTSDSRVEYEFKRGLRRVRITYDSRWHTASLKVNFNPPKSIEPEALKPIMKKKVGWFNPIVVVGAYESGASNLSIKVSVPWLSRRIILVLISYDTVDWVVSDTTHRCKAIVVSSYHKGTTVRGLLRKPSCPVYYCDLDTHPHEPSEFYDDMHKFVDIFGYQPSWFKGAYSPRFMNLMFMRPVWKQRPKSARRRRGRY